MGQGKGFTALEKGIIAIIMHGSSRKD